VWIDGKLVINEGRLEHPKLADLATKMGKQ
jgi:hypothetical protein